MKKVLSLLEEGFGKVTKKNMSKINQKNKHARKIVLG